MTRSAEARRLHGEGHSVNEIAKLLGLQPRRVREALAATGEQKWENTQAAYRRHWKKFSRSLPLTRRCFCGWEAKGSLDRTEERWRKHKTKCKGG